MKHPDSKALKARPSGLVSYAIGFVSAVVLTLVAYFAIMSHWFTGLLQIGVIMGLAVIQLIVQLVFFLHLGREKGSRWKVASFFFMLLVLVVIVFGSLWIMYSLNYNMQMTPEQMDQFMRQQSSKGF